MGIGLRVVSDTVAQFDTQARRNKQLIRCEVCEGHAARVSLLKAQIHLEEKQKKKASPWADLLCDLNVFSERFLLPDGGS